LKYYSENKFTFAYIDIIPAVFSVVQQFLQQNPDTQPPPDWVQLTELDKEIDDYINMLGIDESIRGGWNIDPDGAWS
jgi:hypothetical protein